MMKSPDSFTEDALKFFETTGMLVVLEQTLEALQSALYVTCATQTEAHSLREQAGTDKLKDYWRGREEAAWSIRRHADKTEAAIRLLWRLIPAKTPAEKSSSEELKKKLKQAKAIKRTTA